MQFETWIGLDNYIENAIIDALKEIGEKVNHRMKEYIDIDVYSIANPSVYENTYQLRESVTTSSVEKNENGFQVEVYHDRDKMIWNSSKMQHGNRKASIAEWIPEIVAFNLSGDLFGDGFWMHRDNYFYDTMNSLKSSGELSKWFRDSLRSKGLTLLGR